MFIVLMGGPLEGFSIFGPFDSQLKAEEWAEKEFGKNCWWAVELESP